MLTTINPSLTDFDDTLRILDFAGLTGKIITQRSRVIYDSSVNNKNKLYMNNGRINPDFNTNPLTKKVNFSYIFNNTLSDFNEKEPERSKGNISNISENNGEAFKASAAYGKIFNNFYFIFLFKNKINFNRFLIVINKLLIFI
jgi:hypothetical protein